MRSAVCEFTLPGCDKARETVDAATPHSRATSVIVGPRALRRPEAVSRRPDAASRPPDAASRRPVGADSVATVGKPPELSSRAASVALPYVLGKICGKRLSDRPATRTFSEQATGRPR